LTFSGRISIPFLTLWIAIISLRASPDDFLTSADTLSPTPAP
jgi:hypothetical protein